MPGKTACSTPEHDRLGVAMLIRWLGTPRTVKGIMRHPGEESEVDDATGEFLVASGRAHRVDDSPPAPRLRRRVTPPSDEPAAQSTGTSEREASASASRAGTSEREEE